MVFYMLPKHKKTNKKKKDNATTGVRMRALARPKGKGVMSLQAPVNEDIDLPKKGLFLIRRSYFPEKNTPSSLPIEVGHRPEKCGAEWRLQPGVRGDSTRHR